MKGTQGKGKLKKASRSRRKQKQRRLKWAGIWTACIVLIFLASGLWLSSTAKTIQSELQSASDLLPTLKAQIAESDADAAGATIQTLTEHTAGARKAASDPLWKIASALPWLGPNFQAAGEVATSADDVARLGAMPLVQAYRSLDWTALTPGPAGMNLQPLEAAAPKVSAAAHAVRESAKRLNRINDKDLLPEIAQPLVKARDELTDLSSELNSAADAATLAPDMLGAETPRRYLLLMQNNAESRATGGIPGALAVLSVDKGKLKLESQTSAGAMGTFNPPIEIDPEQRAIYSARVGKFMQDVNLTPDFSTAARTAHSMWQLRTGERLNGVLSLDPVALSYLLKATGPVSITDPMLQNLGSGLPKQLTGDNVVRTLLSDAYAAIKDPNLQDIYFAGAAKEIFSALSTGKSNPKALMEAISKGVTEKRVLLWSDAESEQSVLGKYPLGGLVSGVGVSPSQFGIYFNDGTGAKMDYWVKRSVQVVKDCTRDGYRQITVRVTSTNTAPADAATSLPDYVTGVGTYGVPPGSVQTNVVVYGPAQSNIDTVVKDGEKIAFAAQVHSERAVGSTTVRLAPGQSTSLDFNFGHIVQHAAPEIVVTPTTQADEDVIRAASTDSCE
ncbi:DUF4012 domain-containing protein [Paenarthrobacter sp. NPDC057981]|uniref:DUF4012 domain-containing protein n=1 Tax=Paenarthrobacter sp. NPDC057981 TaxID=3346297 RepID=UPI0036D8707A